MKRTAAAFTVTLLTLALAACGPSKEQKDCEASGGTWVAHFDHFQPIVISTGKVTSVSMVPIYSHTCEHEASR